MRIETRRFGFPGKTVWGEELGIAESSVVATPCHRTPKPAGVSEGPLGPDPRSVSASRLLLEKAPLFVLSGLGCWITVVAQPDMGAVRSLHQVPMRYLLPCRYVLCIRWPIGGTGSPSSPTPLRWRLQARWRSVFWPAISPRSMTTRRRLLRQGNRCAWPRARRRILRSLAIYFANLAVSRKEGRLTKRRWRLIRTTRNLSSVWPACFRARTAPG